MITIPRRLPGLPLRYKILVMVLLLATTVVCSITFIMARTFHEDKASYINDLTSVLAVHMSEKVNATIAGYRDRMLLFTRLLYDQESSRQHKSNLIQQVFKDFQEFVAIRLEEKGNKPVYVYDLESLEKAGLSKDDLVNYYDHNPVPSEDRPPDTIYVENSTISEHLPTLSISIFHDLANGDRIVVTSIIRLEKLLKQARTKSSFSSFTLDSKGNILLHEDRLKILTRDPADWLPKLDALQAQQSTGSTISYDYEGEKMIGGFARTTVGNLLTGVQIPEATAFLTARELLNNLITTSLVILLCTTLFCMILARYITNPLVHLTKITREIAKGNFNVKVERTSNDEIGHLTDSFNTMAVELDTREKALLEAREMATRDGMTGLFNYGYFREALAIELARAKRYDLHFSLIFLDLDHFKNYNDTNGHPEGDDLLRRLAKLLLLNTRGTDIVARYGGEEFVVILPETSKNRASILAEKLRKEIETYPFRGGSTQPLGKVTASMGVSTFPIDAQSADALVKHADDLLYEAKSAGRNTVCV